MASGWVPPGTSFHRPGEHATDEVTLESQEDDEGNDD